MADLFNISIRTGCFCNSGSCQRHLNISNKEMKAMYKSGHKCGDEIDLIDGKPTGAVRVSFGYHNTFDDVDKLILMINKCLFKSINIHKPVRTMINFNNSKKQAMNSISKEPKSVIINVKKFFSGYGLPEANNQTSKMMLSEIAIFPIKSCGAFKIKTGWKIGRKGFEYDREWMIVKDNGVCLTQKQNTLMCKIQPCVDLEKKCLTLCFSGNIFFNTALKFMFIQIFLKILFWLVTRGHP